MSCDGTEIQSTIKIFCIKYSTICDKSDNEDHELKSIK